ncbi:MAG TPA: zinc ribbon domain-containing protein [Actinobacteria bacterium]|nr:zinc ribbon domain-containing protein [Actinomycetota bacterium]
MGEGKLIGFTDNFADNSTEAGFQFTFYCDICREGYKTRFIESKTYKKGKLLKGLGGLISAGSQIAGKYGVGYGAERAADVISERFQGMSPAWHKEHEAAFELAQNEAKQHFHRCPKCTKWVCENDWNEQEGLCTQCAPRVSIEVAAAKAEKAVQDIKEKAAKTQVFTGEIESKQTLCPQCGKPAGEGKFCNNCGAPLNLVKCPKCGAQSPAGTRFCGECGTKLG